jgi:hypothetical protein
MDPTAALLKVTADEPGQLLVLEGERLALPTMLTGVVGGLVGGLVGSLVSLAGAEDSEEWWRPRRVHVDREAGTITIDDVQVLRSEDRSQAIALRDVRALTVRTRYAPPAGQQKAHPFDLDHPRHVEAILDRGDGATGVRVVRLEIQGIDSSEKVADLAYRLGAAMGLRHQRVVRSDPRRLEVEMRAEPGPGLEPMPPLEGAADYIGGRVSSGAARAAAEPRIAAFEPAAWPSASRVTRWSPGDEVRFDKPLEGVAVGCLPVALGGLAVGPALWFFLHDITVAAIASALGLAFAGVAMALIAASLPGHVRIDWAGQELTVKSGFRRRRVPLHRVAALELECVRRYSSGSGRSRGGYNAYQCRLRAHVRGETSTATEPLELVSTRTIDRDPEAPYDAALPLTKALAEALSVEWRVTDYA